MSTARLTFNVDRATVEPGQPVTLEATLENTSGQPNWYSLAMGDVKNEAGDTDAAWQQWITIDDPGPIRLNGGDTHPIAIILAPPKAPGSIAGQYEGALVARLDQAEVATAEFSFTIKEYMEKPDLLVPNMLQAGEETTLSLTNNCNSEQTYLLQTDAPVKFGKTQPTSPKWELTLLPGQTEQVKIKAAAQRRPWFGLATSQENLMLRVLSKDGQEQEQESITVEVPPRLPALLLVLLGLLLCSLASAYTLWVQVESSYISQQNLVATATAQTAMQATPAGTATPTPTATARPDDAILAFTSPTGGSITITEGNPVTLTWAEANLDTVLINGEDVVGTSKEVRPTTTTTYTLRGFRSADDPNPIVRTVTVEVIAAAPSPTRVVVEAPFYPPPGYILNGNELTNKGITLTIEDVGGCTTKRPAVGIGASRSGLRYFTTLVPQVIPGCEDCVPDLCKSVPLSIKFVRTNVTSATVYFLSPTNAHKGFVDVDGRPRPIKASNASENVAYYATYKAGAGQSIKQIDVGVGDQSQPPAVTKIVYQ